MSFFSLLPDILPMILPSAVHVTKASDLEAQRAGTNAPMLRQGAVIGKSDKMCATGKSVFYACIGRHRYGCTWETTVRREHVAGKSSTVRLSSSVLVEVSCC
jgi:hypothetical protein